MKIKSFVPNEKEFLKLRAPFHGGHAEILFSQTSIYKITLFHDEILNTIRPAETSAYPLGLQKLLHFLERFPETGAKSDENSQLRSELWTYLFLSDNSAFSQKVLRYVFEIPRGEVRSYGEIAKAVGHPAAARAVGTVMRKNRFPLIIPCHRVIRSNGSLGDYSGFLQDGASPSLRELSKSEILKIEQAF